VTDQHLKVAGEFGKTLAQEIPLETTIPGHARMYYNAYDNTSRLASAASRAISEIVFEPPAVPLPLEPIGFPAGPEPSSPALLGDSVITQANTFSGYPAHSVHGGSVDEFGKHTGPSPPPRFNTHHSSATQSPYAPPPGPPPMQSAISGQFATFPAARHTTTTEQMPPARPSAESQQPFMPPSPPQTHDVEPSFSDSVADALAADGYLQSLNGNRANPPLQSRIDFATRTPGAQSRQSEGNIPPAPTEKSSHTRHRRDSEYDDLDEGTSLAYAAEPKPPTRSKKLSETLDDGHDGTSKLCLHPKVPFIECTPFCPAHWLRKHSEMPGTPLRTPRTSQDQHRDQQSLVSSNSGERHYRDDAEANSAATREVSREMDALAFGSVPRGPDTNQKAPAGAHTPLKGPPPPLSNVLQTSSRPVSPERSTTGQNTGPPEPSTSSQISSPPRPMPQAQPATQQTGGLERLSSHDYIVPSPPLVLNSSTPAPPLVPPKLNTAALSPSAGPPSPRTISASAFRRPFGKKPTLPLVGGLEKDGVTVAGPPYSSIPARDPPMSMSTAVEFNNNNSTTSLGSNTTGSTNVTPLNIRTKPRLPATPYPPATLPPGAQPPRPTTLSLSDLATSSTNEKQVFYTPSEGRGGDEYNFSGRDLDEGPNRGSTQLPPYPESGPAGDRAIGEIPDETEFMRELELQDHVLPPNHNSTRGYEAGRYSTSLQ
jgi:hypothetical protein